MILHPLSHDPACRVRVARRGKQLSTVAAIDLLPGAAVLFVDGPVGPRPSRHSVQIAADQHVDIGGSVDIGDSVDADGSSGQHLWRFLNHSCEPNAVMHGRILVARSAIARGEDVTFDYDANEWELAEPFLCHCGRPGCRGWIRGFRHLTPAQRDRLAPMVAPHIVTLAMQVD